MLPTLFRIGPVSIHSYGLMVAIAFLISTLVAAARAKSYGIPYQNVFDLGFYVLISALLGARIFHFFQHLDDYSSFWEVFKVWEGGLAYYGGFILALISSIIYLRKNRLSIGKFGDIIGPCIILGISIGRIGCFLTGCCFGKETNLFWGIPSRWALIDLENLKLHPTQLYSSISLFIIFLVLTRLRRYMKFSGQLFLLSIISYSIFRFLIDFLRYYSPEEYTGTLTTSQLMSIIFGVTSIIVTIVLYIRRGKFGVSGY